MFVDKDLPEMAADVRVNIWTGGGGSGVGKDGFVYQKVLNAILKQQKAVAEKKGW